MTTSDMIVIHTNFLRDLRARVPYGTVYVNSKKNEDTLGTNFAYDLCVPADRFADAVAETSDLEAEYFMKHGLNMIVLPKGFR